MALGSTDERDLILPVFTGIREDPLWRTFLRRLLARTRAQRISLFITSARGKQVLVERFADAPGAAPREALDLDDFSDSLLLAYNMLRPNRVYSLDELRLLEDPAKAQDQRDALARAEIAYGRFIRIPAGSEHTAWLFLMHDKVDFTAADSVLMSSLAPHLSLALTMLVEADALRLRAVVAEDALALIGVGQAAFDAEGHALTADAVAASNLDVQPHGRPQLRAREAQSLNAACSELAGQPPHARRVVRFDEREAKDMLLRPAPAIPTGLPSEAATIGLVRGPQREDAASAARVIEATHGLSAREAALAEAVSLGRSIVEAGAELQLTQETARNYSKRIYAKTGASGQADLVRLLLTGLSPFA